MVKPNKRDLNWHLDYFHFLGLKPKVSYSDGDFIHLIERGIPISAIKIFKTTAGINNAEMASYLNISEKTLERYGQKPGSELLDTDTSDKLVSVSKVYIKGVEVFEGMEAFQAWLNESNIVFESKAPRKLLNTATGRSMVMDTLIRIDHGVYV